MFLLLSSVLAIVSMLLGTWLFLKKARPGQLRFQLMITVHHIVVRFEGGRYPRRTIAKAMGIAAAEQAAKATRTAVPKVRRRSFFMDLLLPMAVAKDAQANLDEVTAVWLEQHGARKTRLIRAAQIARIVIGHWSRPLMKIARRFVGL